MFRAVGFYDWMLALHVLAAFAMAAGLVFYTVLVVTGLRATTLDDARTLFRVSPIGGPVIGAGSLLALVLGIVLAIDSDDYHVWDPWVIAAIVLWGVIGFLGQRSGAHYIAIQKLADEGGEEAEVIRRLHEPKGRLLQFSAVALFLVLLLDLVFKPGA